MKALVGINGQVKCERIAQTFTLGQLGIETKLP